ncbi:hypothetical protein Lal_00047597 [Lupinus albus]|uniref:Putative transcription factor bHLH family n=1 Tax=Lupinus albus TaxID=3870 RepID=A0A6A5N9J3_LUPAL|nr:putative transcription factor bHLH family [Lupinus albus]KAF1878925.1 hypothetical protein Lal_00047597 [Lupinus albus]
MEAKQEFGVDQHLNTTITGTSFSQLLLGDDDNEDDNALGLGMDQTYNNNNKNKNNNNKNNNLTDYSPIFPIHIAPQMLCFGNYQNEEDLTNALTPQKSVITNSSDSSSASSCNHTTTFNSLLSKPHLKSLQKKRNVSGQEPVTKAEVGSQRPPKKTKADNPTSTGHAKRKEKLGERIAALQQLVSPFGKTDTASVLHEAMGYIKFLQDQVQVLCSPYLQRLPYSHHQLGGGDNNGEEVTKDLRSRGLCLIPMECTVHVASSNGADFWSPAAIGNNISPSTTMQ